MNNEIHWYESKALWGALISVVSSVAGVTLPIDAATEVITQVVAAIGGAVAFYGRYTAKSVIVSTKKD